MSNDTPLISFQAFVLLIDADNTSADLFPRIMQKVETWGTITIRRVYGNQETLLGQRWKELCLQYALQPVPHIGIRGAKNATDIALTVDAMDLLWLHKESMPNFCLVTGDQDFTALVLRLRSQGSHVYCIGKTAKAEALAKVCTQFLSIEQFSAPTVIPVQEVKPNQITAQTQKNPPSTKTEKSQSKKKQPQLDPSLLKLLTQAAEKISVEQQLEWISLPRLGSRLKQLDTQFQAKKYGYKNLPALVESLTDLFENRRQGMHLEVRLRKRQKKHEKKGKG